MVWAGWTLDAADFGLFSLVLKPAMTELLGFSSTAALDKAQLAEIGKYGGLLAMSGLLGWAFGGFVFGIIADYLARVRALFSASSSSASSPRCRVFPSIYGISRSTALSPASGPAPN